MASAFTRKKNLTILLQEASRAQLRSFRDVTVGKSTKPLGQPLGLKLVYGLIFHMS